MFAEFKKFILRGNVLDLAIGVIIGAAFGKIVTSVVNDILMPVVGLALGKLDFSNFFISLNGQHYDNLADAKKQGAVLAWGNFLTIVINFLVIAFVLFLAIRVLNTLQKKEAEKPPATVKPSPEVELLGEIRDLLKR